MPEDRAIFPSLTVRQNLVLGQKGAREGGRWSMRDMFALFPRLEERADAPAGVLSGGEQQMLTICRTLMGDPELIMVDEPTEGLSPQMVERVGGLLTQIAGRGVAILLVEQKLTIALAISKRLYVMGHGRIVFEGTPADLRGERRRAQGVAGGVGANLSLRERRARFRRPAAPFVMPGLGPGIHDFAWAGRSSRVRTQRRGWPGRSPDQVRGRP